MDIFCSKVVSFFLLGPCFDMKHTLWCRKRGMCGKRVMVAHLGCVLGVMRGMTLHWVKVLILKRDMSRQTGSFQYTKSPQNLGMILKRDMTKDL